MDANSLYYDFSDEDTRQLLTTADNTIHVELGQEPWIIHIIDAIEKVRDARSTSPLGELSHLIFAASVARSERIFIQPRDPDAVYEECDVATEARIKQLVDDYASQEQYMKLTARDTILAMSFEERTKLSGGDPRNMLLTRGDDARLLRESSEDSKTREGLDVSDLGIFNIQGHDNQYMDFDVDIDIPTWVSLIGDDDSNSYMYADDAALPGINEGEIAKSFRDRSRISNPPFMTPADNTLRPSTGTTSNRTSEVKVAGSLAVRTSMVDQLKACFKSFPSQHGLTQGEIIEWFKERGAWRRTMTNTLRKPPFSLDNERGLWRINETTGPEKQD